MPLSNSSCSVIPRIIPGNTDPQIVLVSCSLKLCAAVRSCRIEHILLQSSAALFYIYSPYDIILPSSSRQKKIQPLHCHAVVPEQIRIEQHDVNQEPSERHEINIADRDRCGVSNPLLPFDLLVHIYRLM